MRNNYFNDSGRWMMIISLIVGFGVLFIYGGLLTMRLVDLFGI